jgi:hypothetical protein
MLERFFAYSSPFSLSANQFSPHNQILIRQNADFYLRAFGMLNSTNAVGGRMRRADGSWFTGPNVLHLTGFTNTAGAARHAPIRPQIRYPQSSAFVFDLQDFGGAGDPTIYPVLLGVERYPDNAIPPPALPANYIEEEYTISATFSISGVGTQVPNQTIKCQTGDPFVIRTLRWKYDETVGGAPMFLQIRIRDEYGRQYMLDWVPMRALFAGPDDAQPYPGITFPEWTIPALGSYTFDVFSPTEAGPFTVELAFGGVRLLEISQ